MASAKMRMERALLNLPRLIEMEQQAILADIKDADSGTHFISRLIIALNTAASEIQASKGSENANEVAAATARLLLDFGERCGQLSDQLRIDDGKPITPLVRQPQHVTHS